MLFRHTLAVFVRTEVKYVNLHLWGVMGIGMPFAWCSNALRSLLEHHIFSQISSRQLAAPHITIFASSKFIVVRYVSL